MAAFDFPNSPSTNDTHTANGVTWKYNGYAWDRVAGSTTFAVPSGGIIIWSGAANAIPSGWVLCNGSNSTPDLRGKFIVGYSNTDNDFDVNDEGGEKTKQLGTANLPSHTHQLGGTTGSENLTHTHSYTSANYPTSSGPEQNQSGSPEDRTTFNVSKTTGSNGTHGHNISGSTGNRGGGGSHENRPPYYALCYIMKT